MSRSFQDWQTGHCIDTDTRNAGNARIVLRVCCIALAYSEAIESPL